MIKVGKTTLKAERLKKICITQRYSPVCIQLSEQWQSGFSRQESGSFLPEKFKQTKKEDLKTMTFPHYNCSKQITLKTELNKLHPSHTVSHQL